MQICQCASTLLVYTSTLTYAFRAYFLLFSHHLKHTDLSPDVPSDPYPHTILSLTSVSSLIFIHKVQACPSISPNVPKIIIIIIQAIAPVKQCRQQISENLHPPPCLQYTASIYVPVRINIAKPSTGIYILSITSRRIWKPAGCVTTLLLRTYSTWIASCRRISSMHADG